MPVRPFSLTVLAAGAALGFATPAGAGLLSISESGAAGAVCLDFDSFVKSGHNGVYAGAGLNPGGPVGGACSNTWAVRGLSDGPRLTEAQTGQASDALFTKTYTTERGTPPGGGQETDLPTDFRRGTSDGSLATSGVGGLYGFDVDGGAGVDRAFGVRTGGGDFGDGAAGEVFLRFKNTTGAEVTKWAIDFDVLARNDTDRGGELSFAHAVLTAEGQTDPTLDNAGGPLDYTAVDGAAVAFAETAAAAGAVGWTRTARALEIMAAVPNGGVFQLRWRLPALTGGAAGGLGDAFALDNIKITANPGPPSAVPEPASVLLFGLCGAAGAAGWRRRKAK